jgi:hypothetical protein
MTSVMANSRAANWRRAAPANEMALQVIARHERPAKGVEKGV